MRALRALALACLWLAASSGRALGLPAGLPAKPQAPVTDLAGMLSAQEKARLNAMLTAVWRQGQGPQVAVVTLPDLGGDSVENVSLEIARGWGLGDKVRDDGVLLLIAKADRKLRIEVGTHFEGVLTDVASHRIIDDVMVPAMRSGDFDGAVEKGVAHILSHVAPGSGPEVQALPERQSHDPRVPIFFLFFFFWIVLSLLSRLGGTRRRGGRWGGGGGWGSGGGWGGGSGGGFSGGGGGFSGGGSSGSW